MRHPILISTCIVALVGLSACSGSGEAEVQRAMQDINALDGSLDDVLLTTGTPEEAVGYFTRSLVNDPDNIELQRGLGKSLIKAKRPTDAIATWQKIVARPESNYDDQVELADAYLRANDWAKSKETLDMIPPTHETFKRYRLEAMIADSREQWDKADAFYQTAIDLTTKPANVYNNWGYSKLTRGDYVGAERLFYDALRHEQTLYTAKNNIVLARGAQRKYDLPVIQMNQTERAQLLHTLALAAIKQNDVTIGKGLLREAIDTHPQHFEEATRALRALEDNVAN